MPISNSRHISLRWFCLLTLSLLAAFAFSCASGDSDDDEDGDSSGDNSGGSDQTSNSFTISLAPDDSGRARGSFRVADGTSKFSVVALAGDDSDIAITALGDSSGTDYLTPGGVQLSTGSDLSSVLATATVPSRPQDPSVDSGNDFSIEVVRRRGSGTIDVRVDSSSDSNLDGGSLQVNVYYVGETAQDSTAREIVSRALQEFSTIFADAGNIGVRISEFDVSGPVSLPPPFDGSSFYAANTANAQSLAVNVFIGGDIQGLGDQVLGLAAAIPGPAFSSAKSAVAVGLLPGAGPDGDYDSDEVRILGETIAHEIGHFMGLFHTDDFDGNQSVSRDPLSDTDSCNFLPECLTNRELIRNLMFFTPVGNGNGGTVSQNQLTDQQRGVLNRYIAVD